MTEHSQQKLAPWVATLALVIAWWLVIRLFDIKSFILPTPWETLQAIYQFRYPLFVHGMATLATTLIGFVAAVVFGMALGILVGSSRLLYSGIYPLLVGFNSVPKAALVPVFVVWFGAGTIPAVCTAFMLSFFPVVANIATAFATIEPELLEVMRSLGATRWDMTRKIGRRVSPWRLSEYSTRGGTCAYTFRTTMLSRSSSRSCWVNIFLVGPERSLCNSLKRRTLVCR